MVEGLEMIFVHSSFQLQAQDGMPLVGTTFSHGQYSQPMLAPLVCQK